MANKISVDLGSEPGRDDLRAEIRWAGDGFALMALDATTGRFELEFGCARLGQKVDVDEFIQALDLARQRLREIEGR